MHCLRLWLIGSGRGISPLPSHRTVSESLPSHGSSCSLSLTKIVMVVPISNGQIVRDSPYSAHAASAARCTWKVPFPTIPISTNGGWADSIPDAYRHSKNNGSSRWCPRSPDSVRGPVPQSACAVCVSPASGTFACRSVLQCTMMSSAYRGLSQSRGWNNSADFGPLHHVRCVPGDTRTNSHETMVLIASPNDLWPPVGQPEATDMPSLWDSEEILDTGS